MEHLNLHHPHLPESVPPDLQAELEAEEGRLLAARREHAVIHRTAAHVRARVRAKSHPAFAAVARPKSS